MNCKACLHPQWTHNGFEGRGKCEAAIYDHAEQTAPDTITFWHTTSGLLGQCTCECFISTGKPNADRRE